MTSNNQFNKVFIGDKCKVHDGIAMRNATVESVDTDNQTYTVIIDGLGTKISNIPFSIWRPVKSDDKEAKEEDGGYYYPLFKFFNDEYGLILLDSEIQEIIYQVDKFKHENN